HRLGEPFDIDLIDDALARQGVALRGGEILLIHTGWCRFYLQELSSEERNALPAAIRSPGLAQSDKTLSWLRDHEIAMVAADNAAVESIPPTTSSLAGDSYGSSPPRMMHNSLISLLGLALGELWALDALA